VENKKTNEELLREQLELLAKRSINCHDELLPDFTAAMVGIYNALKPIPDLNQSYQVTD
jgi:hypothetical protein